MIGTVDVQANAEHMTDKRNATINLLVSKLLHKFVMNVILGRMPEDNPIALFATMNIVITNIRTEVITRCVMVINQDASSAKE
jgi:hypothetical protein